MKTEKCCRRYNGICRSQGYRLFWSRWLSVGLKGGEIKPFQTKHFVSQSSVSPPIPPILTLGGLGISSWDREGFNLKEITRRHFGRHHWVVIIITATVLPTSVWVQAGQQHGATPVKQFSGDASCLNGVIETRKHWVEKCSTDNKLHVNIVGNDHKRKFRWEISDSTKTNVNKQKPK